MAIVVPGADYRQLSGKSTTPLVPEVITIHTMVGTLEGTEAWFTPAGRAYSHLGLGGGGALRQWQNLQFRAASDYEGNPRTISIECADKGAFFSDWSGSDVPAFTPAQRDTLVVVLSWLCHRFGLPKAAITTSCPHERGIGWHRLGIDPWRRADCPRWSAAYAKACPGDRRIHQLINDIIPRVSAPEDIVTPEMQALFDRVLDSLTRIENQPLQPTVEAVQKDLDARTQGFLAVPEGYTEGPVFYVAADLQSKLEMAQNGPVHTLIKSLLAQVGKSALALRLPPAVLDELPTVKAG